VAAMDPLPYFVIFPLLFGSVCSPGIGGREPRALWPVWNSGDDRSGLSFFKYLLGTFMATADTEVLRAMLIWDFTRYLARRVHSLNKSSVTGEGRYGAIVVFCSIFARVPKRANITDISLKPEGRGLLM
jgi:hypothetical protein